MFEILLAAIGVVVDVIAIPTALVVNLVNHQEAMNILFWSHDVKEWLRIHKPDPPNILLVVAGFAASCVAATVIWSAWHLPSPLYVTIGDRIGFSLAGGFVYLSGLALYLVGIRKYFRKEKRGV